MHLVLHLYHDTDILYASRKEGGRWLASIEDCMDATNQGIDEYTKEKQRLKQPFTAILAEII